MKSELEKIELLVGEIKGFLKKTSWLTPVNLATEKEKFFQSQEYNPQLIYPEIPRKQLEDYLAQLQKISFEPSESLDNRLINRKNEEIQLIIALLLARESESFNDLSHRLYNCSYPQKMLAVAQKDAALPGEFKPQVTATREVIKEKIQQYLGEMGLYDWQIKLTELSDFYFRVKYEAKEIWMGKEINWDFCDLDNALAHEIDGHVIRAINMQKQVNPIFQKSWPFYIKTEEGLASYLGDYLSPTAVISRKHHALKYLAGHFAQSNTFRKTYDFLVAGGFTPPLAFRRTFRLKRGFGDTSMPGSHARESMYYQGMREVKEYLDGGGSVAKLYAGKFGLEDLSFVPIPENELIPKRILNSRHAIPERMSGIFFSN